MVLCQIYITNANNTNPNPTYNINSFGRKKIKICKLEYYYTGNNKISEWVVVKSNVIKTKFGSNPFFTFFSNTEHQVGNIHSDLILECELVGNIDIKLERIDGQALTNFDSCLISLDIEDL